MTGRLGARRVAFAERRRHVERGFVEHDLDELTLGRRELGCDHREPGARRLIVQGECGERGGISGAPFDERQLETALAQHSANVPEHAQIEPCPPRRSHRSQCDKPSHQEQAS